MFRKSSILHMRIALRLSYNQRSIRRLQPVLVCLAGAMGTLGAQSLAPPAPKLPRSMEQALALIGRGEVRPGAGMGPTAVLLPGVPDTGVCSVPLLEMQIDRPERFTMQTVKPSPQSDAMPVAALPAPPCDSAKR